MRFCPTSPGILRILEKEQVTVDSVSALYTVQMKMRPVAGKRAGDGTGAPEATRANISKFLPLKESKA